MGSDSKSGGSAAAEEMSGGLVKEMIESLREVLNKNYNDEEILDVLMECEMDADAAAERLLSQDTFQEVKSKRERRKEMKEAQELRAWESGDRVGSGYPDITSGSTQSNFSEPGKTAHRREGSSVASLPNLKKDISRSSGRISSEQSSWHSDPSVVDGSKRSIGKEYTISTPNKRNSGSQPNWLGPTSGQLTMADIVRMGRSNNRSFQMSNEAFHIPQDTVGPNSPELHSKPCGSEMHRNLNLPHAYSNKSEITCIQLGFDDEHPVIEQMTATSPSSTLDSSVAIDSKICYDQTEMSAGGANLLRTTQSDEIHVSNKVVAGQNLCYDASASSSERSIRLIADGAERASNDNNHLLLNENYNDYDRRFNECQKGSFATLPEDVELGISRSGMSLQHLSLGKGEVATSLAEDKCSVVFPEYLQTLAADCSHLSFGTYRAANRPGTWAQIASAAIDGSSPVHLNSRHEPLEDHGGESLGSVHRFSSDGYHNNYPAHRQADVTNQNTSEAARGLELKSSMLDPNFKNIQQISSTSALPMDPVIRDPNSLLRELHSSENTVPVDFLASTFESPNARQSATLTARELMPTAYGSTLSSLNVSTELVPEAFSPNAFSLLQPSAQSSYGANSPLRHFPPRHTPARSYSGIGDSLMSADYNHIESARKMYADSNTFHPDSNSFHDSRVTLNNLIRYRASGNVDGLGASNSIASDYGGFRSSTNVAGSLLQNPSRSASGARVGYEGALLAQYRNANSLPLNQSNTDPTWNYGLGSRMMPGVPESSFYGLQRQNNQRTGYGQIQQPSQRYGTLEYPGTHDSELGIAQEQLRRPSLPGSQRHSSKHLHHSWNPNFR